MAGLTCVWCHSHFCSSAEQFHRLPCKFYNTALGCRFGSECRFLHPQNIVTKEGSKGVSLIELGVSLFLRGESYEGRV